MSSHPIDQDDESGDGPVTMGDAGGPPSRKYPNFPKPLLDAAGEYPEEYKVFSHVLGKGVGVRPSSQ